MVLYRAEADLQPWSRRWWDRFRAGTVTCSMLVENSQSRVQSVVSPPFPSRLLHDPKVAFVRNEIAVLDGYNFTVTARIEACARDGVDAEGVEYVDGDAASWSTVNNFASITCDEDPEVGAAEAVYDPLSNVPRSSFDDPGTYDFVRLYMNATTTGTFTYRVDVQLTLFVNYGVYKLDFINPKAPPVYPSPSEISPIVSTYAAEL